MTTRSGAEVSGDPVAPYDASSVTVPGRVLHPGTATGPVLALDEPVSFWGGVDTSGTLVDPHHPQHGASLCDVVLVMRSGRGSSSSSSVLAELVRAGAGPAAIVLAEADAIVVLGTLVAAELYGLHVPVVQVREDDLATVARMTSARVEAADPDRAGQVQGERAVR